MPPHRARRDGLGPMFPLCFAMTSFGGIIANHIRSFPGFAVFANAVSLPLYFSSSSVFPLDPALTHARVVYPEWLVFLVKMNPLRRCGDASRGAFIHFHPFSPSMGPAITAAMAVGFFFVALYSLRRSRT
jgi:ABC-2 type transport system permease protein